MKKKDLFESEKYGTMEIVRYVSAKEVYVKFKETGNIVKTRAEHIRNDDVRDKMHKSVCNTGFNSSATNRIAYNIWQDMILRCYDKDHKNWHRYGGRGITVYAGWHDFNSFKEWVVDNYIEGYELDKDIISPKAKIYSPSTCVFVPKRINSCLLFSNAIRSEHGIGVTYFPDRTKKYCSRIKIDGTIKLLGYFHSEHDAQIAYKKAKEKHIQELAQKFYDREEISETTYNALMSFNLEDYL